MLSRRTFLKGLGASALLATTGRALIAQTDQTVSVATIFAAQSPQGQVLTRWGQTVEQRSGGRLRLQFLWSHAAGTEAAVARDIRSGRVGGAALSAVGLAAFHRPILGLQLPGIFKTWPTLSRALTGMDREFRAALTSGGAELVGWTYGGPAHLFARGIELGSPARLSAGRAVVLDDDLVGRALFETGGAMVVGASTYAQITAQLGQGTTCLWSSSAAVRDFGWLNQVNHLVTETSHVEFGGLVLGAQLLSSLPADLRDLLLTSARGAVDAWNRQMPAENDAALRIAQARCRVIQPTAAERSAWDQTFRTARQRLSGGVFPAQLVQRIERMG